MITLIIGGRVSGKTTKALELAPNNSVALCRDVVSAKMMQSSPKIRKSMVARNTNIFLLQGLHTTTIIIDDAEMLESRLLGEIMSNINNPTCNVIVCINPPLVNEDNPPYWYKLYLNALNYRVEYQLIHLQDVFPTLNKLARQMDNVFQVNDLYGNIITFKISDIELSVDDPNLKRAIISRLQKNAW